MRTPEAEDGLAGAFLDALRLIRTFPSAGTETDTRGLSWAAQEESANPGA